MMSRIDAPAARLWTLKPVFCGLLLWSAGSCLANAAGKLPTKPLPFSTHAERCIIPASEHHQVNFHVLRAILVVESGLKPGTVARNNNNTVDVGIAGINSVHFGELSRFGIGPNELLDECISTYVAAWKLKKAIAKHGNTWQGIASYHSTTPHYNARYQILLQNELIRSGQILGQIKSVPPIGSAFIRSSIGHSASVPEAAQTQSNLIFDER